MFLVFLREIVSFVFVSELDFLNFRPVLILRKNLFLSASRVGLVLMLNAKNYQKMPNLKSRIRYIKYFTIFLPKKRVINSLYFLFISFYCDFFDFLCMDEEIFFTCKNMLHNFSFLRGKIQTLNF